MSVWEHTAARPIFGFMERSRQEKRERFWTSQNPASTLVMYMYMYMYISFFALYSLLLLYFFLYLKSVPIYVIVHVAG